MTSNNPSQKNLARKKSGALLLEMMIYLHTKLTPNKSSFPVTSRWVFFLFLIVLGFIGQCRVSPLYLEHVPPRIETMEGYASLAIKRESHFSRGKISFLVLFPDKARIDMADPLGRTRAQVFFLTSSAHLVFPREKVYWEGTDEELFDNFFGFSFTWKEWSDLLINSEALAGEWQVERDSSGRIRRGIKNNLVFVIENYAGQTSVVAKMTISFPHGELHWRLSKVLFNRSPRAGIFSLRFKNRYLRKTWEEIRDILK